LNKHRLSSEKIIQDCINGDTENEFLDDEKETRMKQNEHEVQDN
jgi:hypothetical protein